MRQLAILGRDRSSNGVVPGTETTFKLEGVSVRAGVIETQTTPFDPNDDFNADSVQFRVKAFSCNYRELALILKAATSTHQRGYYAIGSDFVGEVLAVGKNVTSLSTGDRVIPDHAYASPFVPDAEVQPGIVTNNGSREIQVVHQSKLMRVPAALPDTVAASFSVGAQTAYSMVRRLKLLAGERVLVTGAKSSTALFVLAALRLSGVEVVGLSTSARHAHRLKALGMSELIVIDPTDPQWWRREDVLRQLKSRGMFHAVVDPFTDIYLPSVLRVLGFGGRYIACGVADQHSALVGNEAFGTMAPVTGVMGEVMTSNITLIGNCLGIRQDLAAALDDAVACRFPASKIARGNTTKTRDFFEKTFLDKSRFGKTSFFYDDF